jgi:hypothetical protein
MAQSLRGFTQQTSASSSPTISTSGETAVDSVERSSSNIICLHCHELTQTSYNNRLDPAEDLDRPCHGWPELVNLIVKNPGFEAFQAFRDLNIKSLLYYQAELVKLRKDLHRLEWNDHRKGKFDDAHKLCSRVDTLLLSEGDTDKRAQRQIKLVKKIRGVLKEYSKILTQKHYPKCTRANSNGFQKMLHCCSIRKSISFQKPTASMSTVSAHGCESLVREIST